jgi:hypothetical protein
MDPNQERRDECKVCRGFLPKRKSKFCSDLCERRMKARKQAFRFPNSRKALTVKLMQSVSEVTWVPREEQKEVAQPNNLYRAGDRFVLVADGRLVAHGPVVKSGEPTAMAKSRGERSARLAEARKAEREEKREAEREAAALRKHAKVETRGTPRSVRYPSGAKVHK